MKIFISWSKNKSRKLAEETKNFLEKTLENKVEFFFSPEMYKGTCVDNMIHQNLIECEKCIVCITAENFKNPWLLYEAGVIYGANFHNGMTGIVIPILFESIPEWSSWIDKPLNRYVPIQMQNNNAEFSIGKADFKKFLKEIANASSAQIKNFESNWKVYEQHVKSILDKEQVIPNECKELVNRLLENDNETFSIVSPEISKDRILFHKGFTTNVLTKILIDSVMKYQGRDLWIYGRKNKKLMSRENESFFEYLATEGIYNGVDFRCLFPCPKSKATVKASSKDRDEFFELDLKASLAQACSFKNRFGLPIEKLFRLYIEPRKESIIKSDNAILYRNIVCDSDGYPLPYTNASFEVLSSLNNSRGISAVETFETIWNDNAKSLPLTQELFDKLYNLT